jgi:hypothetical protein
MSNKTNPGKTLSKRKAQLGAVLIQLSSQRPSDVWRGMRGQPQRRLRPQHDHPRKHEPQPTGIGDREQRAEAGGDASDDDEIYAKLIQQMHNLSLNIDESLIDLATEYEKDKLLIEKSEKWISYRIDIVVDWLE